MKQQINSPVIIISLTIILLVIESPAPPVIVQAVEATRISSSTEHHHKFHNHSRFVYKYCSEQKLKDEVENSILSSTRDKLVNHLLLYRSIYSTYAAVLPAINTVSVSPLWGKIQCQGELTPDECHSCLKSVAVGISSNYWSCPDSVSARIQLAGCRLQYESDGAEIYGPDLTHVSCSSSKELPAAMEGQGQGLIAEVLEAVESGVMDSPTGFCSVSYKGFEAVAQCEEGMDRCDCGECVGRAAATVEEECSAPMWGEVYLDACFLRFEYMYMDGSGGGIGRQGRGQGQGGNSNSNSTRKIAAIAIGVVALIAVASFFARRWSKRGAD